MNTALWILQVVLCVKFVSTAYTHGLRRSQAKWQQGMQRMGAAARPLLTLIAILVLVGGAGLVLPGATGILTWLTPLSAAVLAVMMLVAVGLHVRCRETPNVVPGLVLFALAAFCKQLFLGAVRIFVNHRHTNVQDGLGGTVILFQQYHLGVLEILLEPDHIAVVSAAPAID